MWERSVLLGAGDEAGVDEAGVDEAGVGDSVRWRDAKLARSEVGSPASVQKDM